MTISYLSALEEVVNNAHFNNNTKLTELRERIINDISQLETELVIANTSNVISILSNN
jgi:hypothetical protein